MTGDIAGWVDAATRQRLLVVADKAYQAHARIEIDQELHRLDRAGHPLPDPLVVEAAVVEAERDLRAAELDLWVDTGD